MVAMSGAGLQHAPKHTSHKGVGAVEQCMQVWCNDLCHPFGCRFERVRQLPVVSGCLFGVCSYWHSIVRVPQMLCR